MTYNPREQAEKGQKLLNNGSPLPKANSKSPTSSYFENIKSYFMSDKDKKDISAEEQRIKSLRKQIAKVNEQVE